MKPVLGYLASKIEKNAKNTELGQICPGGVTRVKLTLRRHKWPYGHK